MATLPAGRCHWSLRRTLPRSLRNDKELWISGVDTALLVALPTIGIPMRKINPNVRHLALKKETVRTLGDHKLDVVSAGWGCSVKGSGNIMCSPLTDGDTAACTPANS